MDGIDVKSIAINRQKDLNRSYARGAKSAKVILKNSIKEGIVFSTELIILSILLLVYSGITSIAVIGLIGVAIILLVASVITRSIFESKMDTFYVNHPDKEIDSENNEEYVDDSMNILKMGSYTAIINIITTTISLITVCIVVMYMIK